MQNEALVAHDEQIGGRGTPYPAIGLAMRIGMKPGPASVVDYDRFQRRRHRIAGQVRQTITRNAPV
jgi:hypothetical protein